MLIYITGHIEETKKFLISEIESINIREESKKISTFKEELHDDFFDVACIEDDANNDDDNDELPDLLQCEQAVIPANSPLCDAKECKENCSIETCQKEQCKSEECSVEEECHVTLEKESTETVENIEHVNSNGIIASKPPICDNRDVALEKQLEIVRKQLEELAQLPSTIQATIEAVKKQLAGLIHLKSAENHSNVAVVTSTAVESSENSNCLSENETKTAIGNDLTKENAENAQAENGHAENGKETKDKNEADSKIENGEDSKKDAETAINGAAPIENLDEQQKDALENETAASCKSDSTDIIAAKADDQIAKLKLEQCFSEQRERWFNERKQV